MQLLDQPTTKSPSKGNVKMPKLVIIEYDGTYDKWLSFWNNALPMPTKSLESLVNGLTCRALLDTLATASYASGYISD
ncbi:unnamed protein product [Pocillopora meandrina]|uniref:Uncharacterized protein n=1 Tax=Pocillopora meandrina TaxID=46732 RepID=A0AAU9X0Q0_9CNID|nr:unnamed protein product [Pocillopora meandrina]